MSVRFRFAAACVIAVLGLTTGTLALGDTKLGTEGNVYLANPYTDPAEGYYGFRTAVGDFDGDGIDDLVVSELGTSQRFRVLLGKAYPIGGPYPVSRFTGKTVATAAYGSILATGDFNGDGVDEVAIGDRDSASNAGGGGTVYIYRRSAADSWTVQAIIRQGLGSYNGVDEAGDKFGFTLASGDFDDDGFDDLAIGIPGKNQAGSPEIVSAGAVQVVYGSASGLSGTRDRVFTAANDGLDFAPGNSDQYGYAVAAGDIDADGDDDLAIGVVKRACPNTGERAGGVVILKGSTSLGLSTLEAQAFQPGVAGMLGSCPLASYFGASLSIGKVNGQAYQGLVIGAPLSDVGGVEKTGAVHLMFGSSGGLNTGANKFISVTDLPGGVSIPFLQFGNQVKLGRLRTSAQSLAISSALETVDGLIEAGAMWVLHSGNGSAIISTSIVERLVASARLRIGPPAAEDRFGGSIAIGDFNGDGMNDLVAGAYQHDDGGDANTGGAQVLYQSEFIFKDGFDSE
ncbi:FG-GAP repeat protein [Dokdonella immobilis]|uniref:FG-GAP repeat-containing protein n=1 Tax=Dokdonella immobilis TaxID=578942 RepID=A0A1I4XL69_9GAMM|nr:FG-GAP repeat protein [Dokdonella immobilis]SFN26336.1 FG-GAP repeat-containing protein [Dokdonella immobilis]